MIKRLIAAFVALSLGVALSLAGAGAAQADSQGNRGDQASCTPAAAYDVTVTDSPATVVHHDAVYTRYSYTRDGSPVSTDTPVTHPNHWTASNKHKPKNDPIGTDFRGTGDDEGSWLYWDLTPAYDQTIPAVSHVEHHDAVVCADATASIATAVATCSSPSVATWTTRYATGSVLKTTTGSFDAIATATAGHRFPSGAGVSEGGVTKTVHYTISPALTGEACPPAVTQWYTWLTTLAPGVTTPLSAADVTWPQHLVGVGQLVPNTCGVWYQQDKYTGTQAQIQAVVGDGVLSGLPPEDRFIVQAWHYVYGGDCPVLTPVTPVFPAETQPSCDVSGALPALPTDQPGLTFSWAMDGVTMVASLKTGSTFANGAATSKTYGVPAGPIGYQSTNSEGACYVQPTDCVVNTAIPWSAETNTGDVPPVQGANGLEFAGPHTVAMDYYQRVTAGNMQGLSGMSVTYAPGGTGYQALVVVEVNPSAVLKSGGPTVHYATISSVLGATDTSGTFNVQDGLWYTSAIDSAQPGGMGHPITWAAMTALMPQNTLLSAPSLHQQTHTGSDAISVVTSLSSSCGSINFVPALINVSAGDPTNTNQLCTDSQPVGGVITVVITPHVQYQITDSTAKVVPFDGTTGATGSLAPGTYTVAVAADPGYKLTSAASFPLTITAYDGVCGQLVDHPIVTPVVTSTQLGCTTGGSYTLSNDLNAPTGVIWTVDGSPVAPGTYSVTSARTVNIHAVANGPDYGFASGQQQDWTLTFVAAVACSLTTLALHDGSLAFTGSNPTGLLVLAVFLALFGLVLVLVRRARPLR